MTAPPDNLVEIVRLAWPPVILAVTVAALVAASRWRRHPLVTDGAGALLGGAAFCWLRLRAAAGDEAHPLLAASSTSILVATVFGLVETPLWTRPAIAPLVRLPSIAGLLTFGLGALGPTGVPPDTMLGRVLAGVVLFVSWWATKEAAARHSGLVLVALGAASLAAATLLGLHGGSGRLLAAGAAIVLALVPIVAVAPRVVAGRGFLAPTLVALAGSWIPAAATAEPLLVRGLLLLAAAAPALLLLGNAAATRGAARPAARRILVALLVGLALLVAIGRRAATPR